VSVSDAAVATWEAQDCAQRPAGAGILLGLALGLVLWLLIIVATVSLVSVL
jgi:hypothetical protein